MDFVEDMDIDNEDKMIQDDPLNVIKVLQKNKEKKRACSLRDIMINYISDHIDVWYDRKPEPFDCLNTEDTLEIFNRVAAKNNFNDNYIRLFIHYNLLKFDFEVLGNNWKAGPAVFEELLTRCKRIKELSLDCWSNIPYEWIKKIPKHYPNLEILKVDDVPVHGDFIDALIENCCNLKKLYLSSCVHVEQTYYEKLSHLLNLKFLYLHQCLNLDCSSLVSILNRLPRLTHLTLTHNKLDFQFFQTHLKYENIIYLDISKSEVNDNSILWFIKCMPNIRRINIDNCKNLTSKSFEYLSQIKEITHLSAAYLSENIQFNESIELFFMKKGIQLKQLDLSSMRNVDISIIGKCCPNLIKLSLNHCVDITFDWIYKNSLTHQHEHLMSFDKEEYSLCEVCSELRDISLACVRVDLNQLPKIFTNANNITELKFLPWNTIPNIPFNEQFFEDFFNTSCFKELKVLDISNAWGVTKHVIYKILQRYPHLRTLKMTNCDFLRHEINEIENVIKTSGIPMQLIADHQSTKVLKVLSGTLS